MLAKSLRRTLEAGPSKPSSPKALAPLLPFPDAASDFVERLEPRHNKNDIVLSATNVRVLFGLVKEFRRGDDVRRHGLAVRSKLLFCGPPGCGKTLCAEIFAAELALENELFETVTTSEVVENFKNTENNSGVQEYEI